MQILANLHPSDTLGEIYMDNLKKAQLYNQMVAWANSEEGRDFRASLAHDGKRTYPTLADAFYVMDIDQAEELAETLGTEV